LIVCSFRSFRVFVCFVVIFFVDAYRWNAYETFTNTCRPVFTS